MSSLRKELAKQNDRNNRHNKQTFGKSSLKSGTRNESKPSREEEKQQYSTPDSLAGEEADKASSSELDQSKVVSEPLDKKRGPRGSYDLMDAARNVQGYQDKLYLGNLDPLELVKIMVEHDMRFVKKLYLKAIISD